MFTPRGGLVSAHVGHVTLITLRLSTTLRVAEGGQNSSYAWSTTSENEASEL
jgi:hypothetical protein